MAKRRVPRCEINWCCPYRADLCRFDRDGQCTGERQPSDDFMIVFGNDLIVHRPEWGDTAVRYNMPPKNKALLRAFDRGDDVVGMSFVLEAPKR